MNIKIKEINEKEAKEIDKDLIDFNPIACLACGNKKKIVQRFFLLNTSLSSEYIHKAFKKKLMAEFGLTYYAYDEKNNNLITTAKCPECDGEKMEWDY